MNKQKQEVGKRTVSFSLFDYFLMRKCNLLLSKPASLFDLCLLKNISKSMLENRQSKYYYYVLKIT